MIPSQFLQYQVRPDLMAVAVVGDIDPGLPKKK